MYLWYRFDMASLALELYHVVHAPVPVPVTGTGTTTQRLVDMLHVHMYTPRYTRLCIIVYRAHSCVFGECVRILCMYIDRHVLETPSKTPAYGCRF
jgi:hypothetical protein